MADRLPLTLVIMTGSSDPEASRMAVQLNPAAMLLKPFSEAALLDAVNCAALRSRENVFA